MRTSTSQSHSTYGRGYSPSPCYSKMHYAVSSSKVSLLAVFLVISVSLVPFAIKIPATSCICIAFIFLTTKFYFDVEREALTQAKRMKKEFSYSQINKALKKPPSPEFDVHVRDKVKKLIGNTKH